MHIIEEYTTIRDCENLATLQFLIVLESNFSYSRRDEKRPGEYAGMAALSLL